MSSRDPYVLGHSSRELERLDLQGIIYRDATRRALVSAGIDSGMRVLDLGCGSGDVSRLVASLVGPAGSVVGIDRDQGTVQAARTRAAAEGVENAEFRLADADSDLAAGSFDAMVCRFFLMHQTDPGATLSTAADAVRNGGPIVAIESHMAGLSHAEHSRPRCELYERLLQWKCDVVGGSGADLEAGLRLRQTFLDAGLPAPEMRLEAPVESGADSPIYRYMAESARSMQPRARELGIDDAAMGRVDTLEDRLREAVVSRQGVLVCWPVVAAWSRKPGG